MRSDLDTTTNTEMTALGGGESHAHSIPQYLPSTKISFPRLPSPQVPSCCALTPVPKFCTLQMRKNTQYPIIIQFIVPPVANSPFLHIVLFPLSYHRLVIHEFGIRLLARRRIHAVCAFVAPVGLFGWLFGIAPSWERISRGEDVRKGETNRGL